MQRWLVLDHGDEGAGVTGEQWGHGRLLDARHDRRAGIAGQGAHQVRRIGDHPPAAARLDEVEDRFDLGPHAARREVARRGIGARLCHRQSIEPALPGLVEAVWGRRGRLRGSVW